MSWIIQVKKAKVQNIKSHVLENAKINAHHLLKFSIWDSFDANSILQQQLRCSIQDNYKLIVRYLLAKLVWAHQRPSTILIACYILQEEICVESFNCTDPLNCTQFLNCTEFLDCDEKFNRSGYFFKDQDRCWKLLKSIILLQDPLAAGNDQRWSVLLLSHPHFCSLPCSRQSQQPKWTDRTH